RSVGVVDRLTRAEQRADLDRENRAAQDRERENYSRRQQRKLVSYAEAVKRHFAVTWDGTSIPKPDFLGLKVLHDFPLKDIVPYIDWSPFFMTWELPGKYPGILRHPEVAKVATELFADANRLLNQIVQERLLSAHAVYGFWPANAAEDDIVVYTDESRS